MGVIFGTPGTTYLSYSLVVSPNVYAVFPPRLSVRIYLSSYDCKLTLIQIAELFHHTVGCIHMLVGLLLWSYIMAAVHSILWCNAQDGVNGETLLVHVHAVLTKLYLKLQSHENPNSVLEL